jgi:hypothetical protein
MTLAAYPWSGRLGEEREQWVRNARALSAVRVARTRISLPRGRTQPQAPVWEGHSLRPCCSVGYLEVPAGEWWNENGNGPAGTSLKSSPAWYVTAPNTQRPRRRWLCFLPLPACVTQRGSSSSTLRRSPSSPGWPAGGAMATSARSGSRLSPQSRVGMRSGSSEVDGRHPKTTLMRTCDFKY